MRVISGSTEEEMDENSLQQNGSVVGQIVSQISGQNQNNQQNLNNKDDSGNVPNNTQYSIPGILHYIQHEFNRFELEKSQWDVDRAELQVNTRFVAYILCFQTNGTKFRYVPVSGKMKLQENKFTDVLLFKYGNSYHFSHLK